MRIRKGLVSLVLAVLCMGTLTSTVLAGPHHGGNAGACPRYAVCPRTTCTRTGRHSHGGKTYAPRSSNRSQGKRPGHHGGRHH